MIYGMTSFARLTEQTEQARIDIELKSVNHRFLELYCHLPDSFHALELPLKEIFRKNLERGRIDCRIQLQWHNNQAHSLQINDALLQAVVQASLHISQKIIHAAPISPLEILAWPGMISSAEIDLSVLQQTILNMTNQAIEKLLVMRADEGKMIGVLITQRLHRMQETINAVKPLVPQVIEQQRQRIIEKFQQAQIQVDPERLAQEMILFAQRLDVAEELDRLETHIKTVKDLLTQGGRLGRKLDFLMQELNREANTLGSKTLSVEITNHVVELKVLIEEMREQIQNLE